MEFPAPPGYVSRFAAMRRLRRARLFTAKSVGLLQGTQDMDSGHQQAVSVPRWPPVESVPDARPTTVRRVIRALAQSACLVLAGSVLFFALGHHVAGTVVYGLATLVAAGGCFVPWLSEGIEAFGQWLARVVATVLTWLLLAPFFYLVFLPARLVLALMGKDPMKRRWEAELESYWEPREPVLDAEHYRRQY